MIACVIFPGALVRPMRGTDWRRAVEGASSADVGSAMLGSRRQDQQCNEVHDSQELQPGDKRRIECEPPGERVLARGIVEFVSAIQLRLAAGRRNVTASAQFDGVGFRQTLSEKGQADEEERTRLFHLGQDPAGTGHPL